LINKIQIEKEDSMKQVSRIGITLLAVAVVATGLVAGCADAPLRTETSTSNIRAAEEAGAAKVPQASLHLQLAKEELESARNLSAKGDKDAAKSMLTRAEADAELAITLSHKDAEKAEAREAVERVRQLRKDNQ
jgi:Na+-translocating ferredoxin:NAD+ oxidoreductase RnfG subunit